MDVEDESSASSGSGETFKSYWQRRVLILMNVREHVSVLNKSEKWMKTLDASNDFSE